MPLTSLTARMGRLTAAVCFLLFTSTLAAETSGANHLHLRVGFFPKEGFNHCSKDGIRSGFGYEYLQNLALYSQFTYEYLGYDKSWAQNVEMLERGEIDILPGAQISEERLKKFDFSIPTAYFMTVVSVRAGDKRFPNGEYRKWDGMRVGMARAIIHNDHFFAFARERGIRFTPVWVEDYKELSEALATGKVDAIVTDSLRRNDKEWMLETFCQTPLRIMICKGRPGLLAELNEAIERLNRNQPDLITLLRNEYFSSHSVSNVFFTDSERAFIEKAKKTGRTFTVAINPDRPPYSFIRNGAVFGIQKDIGDRIFKSAGLNFKWVISGSRPDYLAMIQAGQADVIMSSRFSYGEAEKFGYVITQPYLNPALSFLRRKDHTGPTHSIAMYTDTSFAKQARRHFGESLRIDYFPTTEELTRAVMSGRDDCSLMYSEVAERILRQDLRNILIHEVAPGFYNPFRVAIRRNAGEDELVSIVAKAVACVSVADVAEITQSYLNEDTPAVTFEDLFHANPLLYSWLISGILAGIVLLLCWGFWVRRRAYQTLSLLNKRTEAMLQEQTVTLNSIGDGVLVTDAEGRVRLLNPTAAKITGFSSQEAAGLPYDRLFKTINSASGLPVPSPVTEAFRTGRTARPAEDTLIVTRDGRKLHIEESAAPITDAQGKAIGVILVFRDETEAYAQRTRLRQAYAQLEAGTRISQSATFVYNPETREISGSSMLASLLPVRDGRLAMPFEQWVLADDCPRVRQMLATQGRQNSEAVTFDYRHRGENGLEYFRMRVESDLSNPERSLYTGVVQNVTSLKLAFEKMAERQNLWQLAINMLPLMLYVKDADNDYSNVLCNQALANFLGKRIEDINGRCETSFYPPEQCEAFHAQDIRIMKAGKAEEFDELAINPWGKSCHLHTIKTPYTNSAGRHLLIGVSIDTTEITALAGGLKVMNSCLEMLCTEPDTGKAIHQALRAICNHIGAERSYILQFNTEKRTCSTFAEYFQPGESPAIPDIRDRPYSTSPNWPDYFQTHESILIEDVAKDGTSKGLDKSWLSVCLRFGARSLFSNRIMLNGKLWGYIGLAFLNTSRKPTTVDTNFIASVARFVETMLMRQQQQEQLLSALERAKAADRAKSYFVASVSHEIRTPLNAVIGFSELLRDGQVSARDARDYLESIIVSGNALLQIINDVLDLSKLEANQMDIIPEPTDFKAVGEESMKVFLQRALNRKISLVTRISALPPLRLDKMRIRQILFNLIGNAVKFTFSGSVTLQADWKPNGNGTGEFSFAVSDTGIGISAEDQAKLMVPFVQLSKVRGTSAATNGTGLGLSICKRLAEKMGGKLWIQSEPGKGSTFGVTLYGVAEAAAAPAPVTALAPAGAQAPASREISVLLVDDVPMNLKVMEALCRKAGVTDIAAVGSGRDALDALERRTFSVTLTDMWMPGMNGAELAQRIRSIPRHAAMRILAVTADVEAKGSFPMSVFSGMILKPVTLAKVKDILAAC